MKSLPPLPFFSKITCGKSGKIRIRFVVDGVLVLTTKLLEEFSSFLPSVAYVSPFFLSGDETKFEIRRQPQSFEKFLMTVLVFRRKLPVIFTES